MYFVIDPIDADGLDGLFEEFEDNPVDDEDEESEREDYEGESEDFQDGTDEDIEEAEDDSAGYIELPTSGSYDSRSSRFIVGEEVGDPEEDGCVGENGNEDFHRTEG